MTDAELPEVDTSWGVIKLAAGQEFLLPQNKVYAESPAIVLVDDHGFYRAYLPLAEDTSIDAAKKASPKMISNQFLRRYYRIRQLELKKSKPRQIEQRG